MKSNFLWLYLLLLVSLALLTVFYCFFAVDIFEWMYSSEAPEFLSQLLDNQSESSLESSLIQFGNRFAKAMSFLLPMFLVLGGGLIGYRILGVGPLLFTIVTVLLMFEVGIHFFLKNSELADGLGITRIVRPFYSVVANTIQAKSNMAIYDRELSYTLRPGKFVYENVEFSTDYDVNSAGLRDDAESLISPDIIALGDSYTMGWGVESDEVFVSVLEKYLTRKTLNAGISSYGTARELVLLERLDTSAVRTVILQYTVENDHDENKSFVNRGFKQIASSKERLERAFRTVGSDKGYYLFKYSLTLPKIVYGSLKKRLVPAFALVEKKDLSLSTLIQDNKAKTMLQIIENSILKDLNNVEIVLFAIEEPGSEEFMSEVCDLIKAKKDSGLYERIRPVSVMHLLKKSDFFIYDTHFKASGHLKIAKLLTEVLTSVEQKQSRFDYCPEQ